MTDHLKDLLRLVRTRTAFGIAFLFVLFAGLDVWLWNLENDRDLHRHILIALASEAVVVSAAALLAYGFVRCAKEVSREVELHDYVVTPILAALADTNRIVYAGVRNIPWEELFAGANEVYLLVQGWDGWQEKVSGGLIPFLERGGHLNVMLPSLPDPARPSDHRNHQLADIAGRMNRTIQAQREEIERTESALWRAVEECVGKEKASERLKIVHSKRTNWFCGVYFKPHSLVLSLYQHRPFAAATAKVPSFVIRTDVFQGHGKWFEGEWEFLLTDPITEGDMRLAAGGLANAPLAVQSGAVPPATESLPGE